MYMLQAASDNPHQQHRIFRQQRTPPVAAPTRSIDSKRYRAALKQSLGRILDESEEAEWNTWVAKNPCHTDMNRLIVKTTESIGFRIRAAVVLLVPDVRRFDLFERPPLRRISESPPYRTRLAPSCRKISEEGVGVPRKTAASERSFGTRARQGCARVRLVHCRSVRLESISLSQEETGRVPLERTSIHQTGRLGVIRSGKTGAAHPRPLDGPLGASLLPGRTQRVPR
jgi:hypothetical protein